MNKLKGYQKLNEANIIKSELYERFPQLTVKKEEFDRSLFNPNPGITRADEFTDSWAKIILFNGISRGKL
jgi:hypothetical protein